jgi:predicted RecA/RadA family phage recombinase
VSVINVPGLIRGGQVEKYGDGDSTSWTVAAGQAFTGGLLVEAATGDRTGRTAQAGSVLCVGVAMWDGAAGDMVTVAHEGVWFLTVASAVTAGSRVICAASGQIAAAGATPDARTIIGVAFADQATVSGLCPVKLVI